jgi:mannose-6-phosphate isomerase
MAASQDELREVLSQPIPLSSNRVYRFYKGGALIDRFRGDPQPRDTDYPEDWVGSITPANNPGLGHPPREGLSKIALPSGDQVALLTLLESFPEETLGAAHVAKYGVSTGLLVKLLDSSIRLPIHCHPTRPFARQQFSSIFGKTEAWIVVETREIPGVEPYIMLGFKEGVEKHTFRRQVERQQIADMKAGLHRIPVKPGDIFYVKAGQPHAIGEGVFLIEAQEPTDFSILAEWHGFPIDPDNAHIGLGWDVAIDCFDFTNYRLQQLVQEYKLAPQLLRQSRGVKNGSCWGERLLNFSAPRAYARARRCRSTRPASTLGSSPAATARSVAHSARSNCGRATASSAPRRFPAMRSAATVSSRWRLCAACRPCELLTTDDRELARTRLVTAPTSLSACRSMRATRRMRRRQALLCTPR